MSVAITVKRHEHQGPINKFLDMISHILYTLTAMVEVPSFWFYSAAYGNFNKYQIEVNF